MKEKSATKESTFINKLSECPFTEVISWHSSFWNVLWWWNAQVSRHHKSAGSDQGAFQSISHRSLPNTDLKAVIVCLMLLQPTAWLCPLCSLWAAGWWVSVHSLSLWDTEVGKGCLCTPGQPSLLCPNSVCLVNVLSVCSCLTASQTVEQGPWRALGPGPFP